MVGKLQNVVLYLLIRCKQRKFLIKHKIFNATKNILRQLKYNYFRKQKERKSCLEIHLQNAQRINKLRTARPLRIVFLVTHRSIWKVDTIFKKMLADSCFDPKILVCPYILHGHKHMLEELEATVNYFVDKSYPVVSSLDPDGSWLQLENLEPDLLLFTNPNDITIPEYYMKAYSRYPSIYVPYYFMATKHAGPSWIEYSRPFYSSMWRIYWPHTTAYKEFSTLALVPEVKTHVYGYPAVEDIYCQKMELNHLKVEDLERKLLIIYAPHHSIERSENSISTFLENAEIMKDLAIRYKESIHWVFKPHPMLRQKLYNHPLWGVDKTDKYFEFWDKNNFSKVCEGEYEELFLKSDAMIHDCSSFLVEYLFVDKPCLYLIKNSKSFTSNTNEFGQAMSTSYEFADTEDKIVGFVESILKNHDRRVDKNKNFEKYVQKYYCEQMPSDRIVSELKQSIIQR